MIQNSTTAGIVLSACPMKTCGPMARSLGAPAGISRRALCFLFGRLPRGWKRAEEAVHFPVGPGREEERASWTCGCAVAEPKTPQAVDHDRLLVGATQGAFEFAIPRVVCVDAAIAEVSDQEVAAEVAEALRRDGQAPRGVELSAADEP